MCGARIGLLAAAAGFLLAGAGGEARARLGTSPEGVPPPGPLYPRAEGPYLAVGVSGGPAWAADPTLDVGFLAVGHFGLWLSPYVALEIDVGHTTLDDDYYGGELSVNPLVAYLVLSLPLTPGYTGAELVNLRIAAGAGRLSIDHAFTGVEHEGVFALQAGTEWVLSSSSKLFIVVDTMWSDVVLGNRPIFDPGLGAPAIPFWDLETVTTLRVGVEFAF